MAFESKSSNHLFIVIFDSSNGLTRMAVYFLDADTILEIDVIKSYWVTYPSTFALSVRGVAAI